MKKRIYSYMLFITLISAIMLTFMLSFIFYDILNKEYKDYVKSKALDIAFIMNSDYNNIEYLKDSESNERITLIDIDGNVIFDNFADVNDLDNHGNRPEVISAKTNADGEAIRYSTTLSEVTYNYAIKLESGEVLRVSIKSQRVIDVILKNLHIILMIFITIITITNIFAFRVTKKIIEPISEIDFDNKDIPVYKELEPYINKISEQKKELYDKLESIKYQNNAILTITENMKDGIVLLDEKNIILTYNDKVCEIFKTDKNYFGKNIINLFRYQPLINGLKELDSKGVNFVYEKDKSFYQVRISPVYRDMEIKGVVILFVDFTQKELSDKFRREFTANVSHELKTPLMSILGYSELIENGLVKESDLPSFISKIRGEAKTMSNLVEDILLISQLDEQVYKNDSIKAKELVQVDKIVNTIVENLREFARKKNIKIIKDYNEITHSLNEKLFSELVKNLLYNGIIYNKDDGEVLIKLWREEGHLHLLVKDTGVGILKKDQERVFERFYRTEKSRDKRVGGTGLGLAIVKNVVLYHNGEIVLTSEPMIGSAFEVIIP